jgi:hypothetical protein
VDTASAAGPEILRISISIVPPGINDAVDLKRGTSAIVLAFNKILINYI